ncbi:MAG: PIN domain-containing protein [Spirochaetaceae bacterium]|nr:MAG: PIN domain-containing protein [Spirochaetaceae bacterium]
MTRGDLVLADTNVYLSATDRSRDNHRDARSFLQRCTDAGIHCAVTGQILREYLVVATRPTKVNGLGLPLEDALGNITVFRGRTVFLEENEAVSRELEALVRRYRITGKRVHDAGIAAVLALYHVPYLITANRDDFAVFEHLHLLTPGEALSALPT